MGRQANCYWVLALGAVVAGCGSETASQGADVGSAGGSDAGMGGTAAIGGSTGSSGAGDASKGGSFAGVGGSSVESGGSGPGGAGLGGSSSAVGGSGSGGAGTGGAGTGGTSPTVGGSGSGGAGTGGSGSGGDGIGGAGTGGASTAVGGSGSGGAGTGGASTAVGGSGSGGAGTGGSGSGGDGIGGAGTGGAGTAVGGSGSGGAETGGSGSGGDGIGGAGTGGSGSGGAASITFEEGDGFCSVSGAIETTNTGYSGDGYANVTNAAGTTVVWALSAPEEGTVTLTFTFANGGTAPRFGTVLINDVDVTTVNFPATADVWTSWQTASVTVTLSQGNNLVTLESTSADGLPNIDSLTVTPDHITAGECPEIVDDTWTVDGFASTDGGTTGGGNATPTVVTTCAELKSALGASEPAVVQLPSGTVLDCRLNPTTANLCRIACTGSNDVTDYIDRVPVTGQTCADLGGSTEPNAITRYDYSISVASNKTLQGLGQGATILGASLNLSQVSNVIIQNIALSEINAALIEAGDGLTINGSDHVFINHCEFSMISDGYMDIRENSSAITVSYSVLNGVAALHHDCSGQHNFISLVTESEATYHHNYFYHGGGRNPKVSDSAFVHLFNNYYDTISYFCANSGTGSEILVENNSYHNARYPHWADGGIVEATGNVYTGTTTASGTGRDNNGNAATPPYAYTPEDAAALNATIPERAGLGTLP